MAVAQSAHQSWVWARLHINGSTNNIEFVVSTKQAASLSIRSYDSFAAKKHARLTELYPVRV